MNDLVPDRECGGCTVCCRELTIDTAEMKKLPGILCEHCEEGRGCGIHAIRPALCRGWHCGWRKLSWLDDAWRPDRSGVLIAYVEDQDIPVGYSLRPGIRFTLLRPLEAAMWDALVARVLDLVQSQVPVFLSTSGRPGYTTGRTFLNDGMARAAGQGDHALISSLLEQALLVCLRYVGEPIDLANS